MNKPIIFKKWIINLLAGVLMLGAAVVTVPGISSAADPFRIALITDQTGPVASLGVPLMNGFQAAIAQANDAGGVLGKKIVVDSMNDNSDLSVAQTDVQTAISNGDLGIFGGMNSGVWGSLGASAAQNHIAEVTVGATDGLLYPPQPYVYRSQAGAHDFSYTMIGFVKDLIAQKKLPKMPKVAVYIYSSATTQMMASDFTAILGQLGWPLVSTQTFSSSSTNNSVQSAAIGAAKPDVILAAWLDTNAGANMTSLIQNGFTGPVVDFVGASAPGTYTSINNPNYYAQTAYVYPSAVSIPAVVTMNKAGVKSGWTTGANSPWFTQGYVQGLTALAALKKCGVNCTSILLNDALDNLGPVTDAASLAYKPSFTPASHELVGGLQFFHLDKADGSLVAAGNWVPLISNGATAPPSTIGITGVASHGKTASLKVLGLNFDDTKPTVTSSAAGTKVRVTKVLSTSLALSVTTPAGTRKGSYVLTIEFDADTVTKIKYSVN